MAIIYTYPVKTTPVADDLILISDSADNNATKQIKVSTLPFSNNLGTVTSVGVSMPSAFAVANSPVTSSGTIAITTTGGSSGQYLAHDGTWGTPAGGSAVPSAPVNSVQFNNAGSFGGSDLFTYSSRILSVGKVGDTARSHLKIYGGGSDDAKLTLYCSAGTHGVTIEGPDHTGGTPASYTIKLPNSLPSVANQILESNASGALSWIATPSGGSPGGSTNEVQFKNAAGNFAGSADLTYNGSGQLTVGEAGGNKGIVRLQGEDGVDSGILKIGHSNTTKYLSLGLGNDTMAADYSIDFPVAAPGGNNKILESNSSGVLSWISTPTGGGVSFSGSTANGIATYSSATQANVSSVFTVSGNKLSAPAGSVSAPSLEVGAVGGLYAASGGIFLAHSSANAIGVNSSSITNYKLTQFDAGLKFGSAGGTLNKYEEGTWTPTAYVAVGSAPTVTSSNGTYTIIGDICHITFKIIVTGSSSANVGMLVGGIPAAATADATAGEKSAGQLFVNSDGNTPAHYPSIFSIQGVILTMIVQGGSKNSFRNDADNLATPFGLKAGDLMASWYRPTAGSGITLEGSATYKLA